MSSHKVLVSNKAKSFECRVSEVPKFNMDPTKEEENQNNIQRAEGDGVSQVFNLRNHFGFFFWVFVRS